MTVSKPNSASLPDMASRLTQATGGAGAALLKTFGVKRLSCVLAALLPATAWAAPPQTPPARPLPPPDAPAVAYGPLVRGGEGAPNANDLAGLAARAREAGHLANALALSLRARRLAPHNVQAIQTEVSTLSNLGAAHRAYTLAKRYPDLFKPEDMQRFRVDATAADIRDALRERRRLEDRFLYAQRNDPLRRVLAELDANLAALPKGTAAYVRTQQDRVQVLSELGRMSEALQAYAQLQAEHDASPVYVRQAAAAAWLQQRHPKRAAAMYGQIVEQHPGVDVEMFIARYYALIEAERYKEAERLLENIDRVTPVWLYGPAQARSPNWERIDVDTLTVLDASYRNKNALSERRALQLYQRAPHNTGLINTYATVLRWRGWPLRAQRTTALAAAYAPQARDTRINQADNARDLGEYRQWGQRVVALAALFPEDTTVKRSLAEWNDRKRPSMSAQYTIGRSDGGVSVNGNRDRALQLRVNTPWSDGGWRAYARQDYRWSDYEGGAASFNRVGLGGEWRWARQHAWFELSSDRLTGRHPGVLAGWSQWLNDIWQYSIQADSRSTQTPLRAERAGLFGRSVQGQVTWRASESRSASFSAGWLDISDGNHRVDLSGEFTQRIQASAHHLTDLSMQIFSERNSRPGGEYFNPSSLHSVGASLEHDWITWRRYERSLTQRFTLTAASEWQSGYGSAVGVDAQYGQDWQVSRTWSLNFGVGWGSHVYDGRREHRMFGTIGFSGVF